MKKVFDIEDNTLYIDGSSSITWDGLDTTTTGTVPTTFTIHYSGDTS